MKPEEFFNLFLDELKGNSSLHYYYKFLENTGSFLFRKAYFCQRLQYIADRITGKNLKIWDCGCGFGTTGLFLAMNGISVEGNTLEHYFKEISARKKFWNKYGNAELFRANYQNLFDISPEKNQYDIIIVQDTLHHLEPIGEALKKFHFALSDNGKIIAVEENGNNIAQNIKLFLQRGNKKIIDYADEKSGKKILMGNENIRSLNTWKREFSEAKFIIQNDFQYVRMYYPRFFNESNYEKLIDREQQIWKRNSFLREYFFFGLNFTAVKS